MGLITDVGNDLLYGAEPSQIENWVATCLARLGEINAQLILTELPLANLQHLSPRKFTFFSKLFFPFCQLSLSDARNKASELNQRLLDLAARFGASTIKPDPTWYGFDPIHIRYAKYPCAWSQILGAVPSAAPEVGASPVRSLSALTRMRIAWVAPHRRQLLHWVQSTMQPSMILADGSRIAVY